MKNILTENMRRFGTKNLREQTEDVTRVGDGAVIKNAKIDGNTMTFKVSDIDFDASNEGIVGILGMYKTYNDIQIQLKNIKHHPATPTTAERYTVSSINDIVAEIGDDEKRGLLFYLN